MDFMSILSSISLQNIHLIPLFFKSFGLIFGFIYAIYAVVLYRQVGEMNHTLQTSANDILTFIALGQILVAILIITLAIFFI